MPRAKPIPCGPIGSPGRRARGRGKRRDRGEIKRAARGPPQKQRQVIHKCVSKKKNQTKEAGGGITKSRRQGLTEMGCKKKNRLREIADTSEWYLKFKRGGHGGQAVRFVSN